MANRPGMPNYGKSLHWLAALAVITATGAFSACDKGEKAKQEAENQAELAAKAANEAKEAAEKAAVEKQQAEVEAAKAQRAQARADLQKQIDAADRKIEYLKGKVDKAKGNVKKNAEAAKTELDKRHDSVTASMKKLEDDGAATWDAAKAEVERDIAALDQSVESFERTLTTVK